MSNTTLDEKTYFLNISLVSYADFFPTLGVKYCLNYSCLLNSSCGCVCCMAGLNAALLLVNVCTLSFTYSQIRTRTEALHHILFGV